MQADRRNLTILLLSIAIELVHYQVTAPFYFKSMTGITTIDQSRRLLQNASISRDTADMYYRASAYTKTESGDWVPQNNGSTVYLCVGKPEKDLDVPAWSLAALWELCSDLSLSFSTADDSVDGIIETLVNRLVENSTKNQL